VYFIILRIRNNHDFSIEFLKHINVNEINQYFLLIELGILILSLNNLYYVCNYIMYI